MRDWLKRPIAIYVDAGRCTSKGFFSNFGASIGTFIAVATNEGVLSMPCLATKGRA